MYEFVRLAPCPVYFLPSTRSFFAPAFHGASPAPISLYFCISSLSSAFSLLGPQRVCVQQEKGTSPSYDDSPCIPRCTEYSYVSKYVRVVKDGATALRVSLYLILSSFLLAPPPPPRPSDIRQLIYSPAGFIVLYGRNHGLLSMPSKLPVGRAATGKINLTDMRLRRSEFLLAHVVHPLCLRLSLQAGISIPLTAYLQHAVSRLGVCQSLLQSTKYRTRDAKNLHGIMFPSNKRA